MQKTEISATVTLEEQLTRVIQDSPILTPFLMELHETRHQLQAALGISVILEDDTPLVFTRMDFRPENTLTEKGYHFYKELFDRGYNEFSEIIPEGMEITEEHKKVEAILYAFTTLYYFHLNLANKKDWSRSSAFLFFVLSVQKYLIDDLPKPAWIFINKDKETMTINVFNVHQPEEENIEIELR